MNQNSPYRPVLRTQADLERMWRFLMGPLGFAGHSIWAVYLDRERRPIGQIVQIEDVEHPPGPDGVPDLVRFLTLIATDFPGGGRWAFLRSRPGSGGPSLLDRQWARVLIAACAQLAVPCEPVHLAHDHAVVPITGDDLMAA